MAGESLFVRCRWSAAHFWSMLSRCTSRILPMGKADEIRGPLDHWKIRLKGKATVSICCGLVLLAGFCTNPVILPGSAREIGIRPLHLAVLAAPDQRSAAGTYHGHAPAADAAKRVFTLSLDPDGSATLTTVYIAKGRSTEHGRWQQNGEEVVLTFDPIGSHRPPEPITFRYHHHTLHPTQWDRSEWGQAGPPVLSRSRSAADSADPGCGAETCP
jgi:hypothetical protein